MLMARADWRDDYAYDPDGTLLGWTRTRGDRDRGVHRRRRRILGRGADGSPIATEAVAYPLAPRRDGHADRRGGLGRPARSLSNSIETAGSACRLRGRLKLLRIG